MNKRNSSRYAYMDIAKALMMICLMFGHCALGLQSETLTAAVWHDYFLVFYMQGFFVVTGYCSNFEKPLVPFLKSNFKTLVIPAILFTIICRSIFGLIYKDTIEIIIERIFNSIGYWFLWAMFFAKLLYWGIRRTYKDSIIIVLMFMIFLIASFFSLQCHGIKDPFFIRNAMLCSVFLCIGEYLKKFQILERRIILMSVSLVYVMIVTLLIEFALSRPSVTAAIIFGSWKDIPLHLFLAISGSISCLYISQIIGHNSMLELIGRNTLCIYGFHVFVLEILLHFTKMIKCLDYTDTLTVNMLYIAISILTLFISLGLSIFVTKHKCFCYLTGKW